MIANGWFVGSTEGPCREWQEMMEASEGRCFSKASISGTLQDVCPPTMAFCLVASGRGKLKLAENTANSYEGSRLTGCKLGYHLIDDLGLDAVDDKVANTRDEVAVRIDVDVILHSASASVATHLTRSVQYLTSK